MGNLRIADNVMLLLNQQDRRYQFFLWSAWLKFREEVVHRLHRVAA